jgi:hypothetical protein
MYPDRRVFAAGEHFNRRHSGVAHAAASQGGYFLAAS